ncbi:hypothetical protein JB92DRAFT_2871404 [Gautieria morchelliformis]|nr:hypothetical protein JB92DRAFT_3072629 [Gautieria morchelliformis]KAF8526748.1 hypothetical protein JB92DRAFT_2871404 [Gautieria morchelliformis]
MVSRFHIGWRSTKFYCQVWIYLSIYCSSHLFARKFWIHVEMVYRHSTSSSPGSHS